MPIYRIRVLRCGCVLFDDDVDSIFGSQTNFTKVYNLGIVALEITKESNGKEKNKEKNEEEI